MRRKLCAWKPCRKPLKPYVPPTKDVPVSLGEDDPFCCRECCERAHGVWKPLVKTEWT